MLLIKLPRSRKAEQCHRRHTTEMEEAHSPVRQVTGELLEQVNKRDALEAEAWELKRAVPNCETYRETNYLV